MNKKVVDYLNETVNDIHKSNTNEEQILEYLEKNKIKFKILKNHIKLVNYDYNKKDNDFVENLGYMIKYDSNSDYFKLYPRVQQHFNYLHWTQYTTRRQQTPEGSK